MRARLLGHAPCLEGLSLTCGVVVAGGTDVVVLVAAVVEGGGVVVSAIGVLDLIVAESWSKDNLSVLLEVQLLQCTCFNAIQWRCQVKHAQLNYNYPLCTATLEDTCWLC